MIELNSGQIVTEEEYAKIREAIKKYNPKNNDKR